MNRQAAIHMFGQVDLGVDASLHWVWRRPLNWPEDAAWEPEKFGLFPDDVYGFVLSHTDDLAGRSCFTMCFVKEPYDHTSGTIWKVLEWDPFTLEKAIECSRCGVLGTIEGGYWSLV